MKPAMPVSPHPNLPPQAGEGANESLREFHTNAGLLARSLSAVWHPCSQMKHYENFPLVPIARGQGVWLYDCDGKRYLDAVSSCPSASNALQSRRPIRPVPPVMRMRI